MRKHKRRGGCTARILSESGEEEAERVRGGE